MNTTEPTTLQAARTRVTSARAAASDAIWAFARDGFASLELAENLAAAARELATATGLMLEMEAQTGSGERMQVMELEDGPTTANLGAAMLHTVKAWHPCSHPALITGLMLALREEIDRGNAGRECGLWLFAELLKLNVQPGATTDPHEQAKPGGVQ